MAVYIEITDSGNTFYYKDREMKILHRTDGPAIEWSDGGKSWYLNGNRHREDGPAAEYANGSKFWWLNGNLHREDGPAIEYANGSKFWYLNGEELPKEEFNKRTSKEILYTIDEIAAKLGIDVSKLKIAK